MFENLKAKLTGVPSLLQLIEEVPAHYEHHFGPVDETVFHEIVSPEVHIDVYFTKPNDELGFRIIFASGMAMRAMPKRKGETWPQLAELMMILPNNWPICADRLEDEEVYWPIRYLKKVSRMPHNMNFCLHEDHSIPFGDPPELAPNTSFGGVLVVKPTFWPPQRSLVQLKSGLTVQLYVLMPLTMAEMDFKASQPQADGFRTRLEQLQCFDETSMVANPVRPSFV